MTPSCWDWLAVAVAIGGPGGMDARNPNSERSWPSHHKTCICGVVVLAHYSRSGDVPRLVVKIASSRGALETGYVTRVQVPLDDALVLLDWLQEHP